MKTIIRNTIGGVLFGLFLLVIQSFYIDDNTSTTAHHAFVEKNKYSN